MGRFLEPDPIGFLGGVNFYAYVGNCPVRFIDPWGWCKDEPAFKQFLGNLSGQSTVAGTMSMWSGQLYLGTVYYGIAAGSSGLEIALYSDNKVRDTVVEVIKSIIPTKEPFNLISDAIIDFLNKKINVGKKSILVPQYLPAH